MSTDRQETYRAFLMTDIVGSTALTQQHPHAYREALALHNSLAEKEFAAAGGRLLKSRGQGDGLLGAFANAADALRAAICFRSGLDSIEVDDICLTCRLAVHYGVCYGMDEDYFGHTLNLCARLRDCGHGGQILCSGTVADLAGQLVEEDVEFVDLGWYGLRDVSGATRIVQVQQLGKGVTYPPLRTNSQFRMPTFGTPFIGRDAEINRISTLLDSHRSVVILGPGGMGKTRLAAAAAEQIGLQKGCPVTFLSLIEAVDRSSVEQVILNAFGEPGIASLGKVLDSAFLVVADNCEHVAEECRSVINYLLTSYPKLRVIVTSRRRIVVSQSATLNLDGLDSKVRGDAEDLFVRVAQSHDATFAAHEGDRTDIEALCEAAEGIPLVIELAASHISSLSVRQIKDRIIELSRTSTPHMEGRHQSIDAAIGGTVMRLTSETRDACSVLASFPAGFTLETAQSTSGPSAEIHVREMLDNSLLRFDRSARPNPRYRFLEVIRTFLRDDLGAIGLAPSILAWAVDATARLSERYTEGTSVEEATAEMPNFRLVLREIEGSGDGDRRGLAIATHLARFWLLNALAEGRTWMESFLRLHPEPANSGQNQLYADAYNRLGVISYRQQDRVFAAECYSKARRYAEACGNIALSFGIKLNEALVYGEIGKLESARPLLAEAEDYFRNVGMTQHWLKSMANLARVDMRSGSYAEAAKLLGEAASLAKTIGDTYSYIVCQLNMAEVCLLQNSDQVMELHLDEVANLEQQLDPQNRALFYLLKGVHHSRQGMSASAEASLAFAEDILSESGETMNEFDLNMKGLVRK